MFARLLKPLKSRSFFLFGARACGKSTFLSSYFSEEDYLYIDLLDPQLIDDLRLDIGRFKRIVTQPENCKKIVIVDEIQKMPELLNYIHQCIFKEQRIFILTGSSARRLKQLGTNLLAGRALVYDMYPLTSREIGPEFNLEKALGVGLFPEVYLADSEELAIEILRAYSLTYLEKEIQQEQWVRKIQPFRIFLSIAGQMNGKLINRASIAKDVGVDDMTVASYYEILEDTLLGFTLPAYHKSIRKSQRKASKFYIIDPGLKRAIDRTLTVKLLPQTSAYGEAFEHFVILEFYKLTSYARNDWRLSFFQTKEGFEIDLIIERPGDKLLLVEIKSKKRVFNEDVAVINRIGPEIDVNAEQYLLSQDAETQYFGKTTAMHWQKALELLYGGPTKD
jgi:predicted AAA+ superfamily ATPase